MKSGIVVLFALASFLAALLSFSAQPMIGKMALPVFGGTPAVWNTCLVFFQGMLLCGYLLAHGVGPKGFTAPRKVSVQNLVVFAALLVLGYLTLPILVSASSDRWFSPGGYPAFLLLGALCVTASLPLVLVSTTAPLIQSWFTLTGHSRANDPYFLYSASNAGSLLGLLAYPFVIEPNLGVIAQSHLWKVGYLALAVLVLCCGLVARLLSRSQSRAATAPEPAPAHESPPAQAIAPSSLTRQTWLRWLVLVFIPSSWLIGVTTYLTTDLAAIPLFWVIPLALYLLSFILAFAGSMTAVVRTATRLLPFLVAPLALVMSARFVQWFWIPLHLAAFFAGSLACHGALARARPQAAALSMFYVTIALGGFLGGIWNALVAPLIFNRVVEYPLALVLACLVTPVSNLGARGWIWRRGLYDLLFAGCVFALTLTLATNQAGLADSALGVLGVIVAAGLGILACLTALRRPARFALVVAAVLLASAQAPGPSGRLLHVERDFFGVIRITYDPVQNVHRLFHGSTLHGEQSLDESLRNEPSSYYTRPGPVGQFFDAVEPRWNRTGARVAVVGLGAGTLASYARPGERWTFYEIDPAIERIARDPRYFRYLQDCRAEALDIIVGDARQRLQAAPDHAYQLIVIDAFSSDTVPVHLLSREAIRLYRAKLAPNGLLVLNLSNRYLDLDPVLGRQAADAGLVCRVCYDLKGTEEEIRAGKRASLWAVIAASERDLLSLAANPRWQPARLRLNARVWTDDYSDLARYLMFAPSRLWTKKTQRASTAAAPPKPP